MEQAPGAKEGARAEAGECAKSSAWNAGKRGFLKRSRFQVQKESDGKLEQAPEDFAYV